MAEQVRVWQITSDDKLIETKLAKLNLESRVERWIERDISLLAPNLLFVATCAPQSRIHEYRVLRPNGTVLLHGKSDAQYLGQDALGTPQKFAQHGKSGAWLSGVLPNLAGVADDLCFVKSLYSDQFNHAPAEMLLYSGSPQFARRCREQDYQGWRVVRVFIDAVQDESHIIFAVTIQIARGKFF